MQILLLILGWEKPQVDLRLPPIDDARPKACPQCGQPARLDGVLWIVGHGTYERSVLVPQDVRIKVRRFRCKACGKSLSVLPHWILPRRRYAAPVILQCLRAYYREGQRAREATKSLGLNDPKQAWRTLKRWGADLLVSMTLWGWLGEGFGVRSRAQTAVEIKARLKQVFEDGIRVPSGTDRLSWIVQQRTADKVYEKGRVWEAAHDRPGARRGPLPPGSSSRRNPIGAGFHGMAP